MHCWQHSSAAKWRSYNSSMPLNFICTLRCALAKAYLVNILQMEKYSCSFLYFVLNPLCTRFKPSFWKTYYFKDAHRNRPVERWSFLWCFSGAEWCFDVICVINAYTQHQASKDLTDNFIWLACSYSHVFSICIYAAPKWLFLWFLLLKITSLEWNFILKNFNSFCKGNRPPSSLPSTNQRTLLKESS